MFEELGYKFKDELTQCFYYKPGEEIIIFFKLSKMFIAKTMYGYLGEPLQINIKLNKAIQKQIEELGWLEQEQTKC